MIDRCASTAPEDPLLISFVEDEPPIVLRDRPVAPSDSFACSQRLPRDLLVRLAALSRDVDGIRQDHTMDPGLSMSLARIVSDLDDAIQSIFSETARHLTGRHG